MFWPKLLWFVCTLIFCTLGNNANAKEKKTLSIDKSRTIDSMMTGLLDCGEQGAIPGMALSVVHKGRVLLSRGYGITDMKHPRPVTEKTLFGIGPVTQTFTSTLLAKLLHEHPRFTLTTPLSKVIPGKFRFRDKVRTSQASSEDLLGQRMGLVRHNYMVFQDFISRKRLKFKMRYIRGAGKFRESYITSDIMYSLAAYVTEKLSNASWEELVARELFRPLKMSKSTFFSSLRPDNRNLATAYYPDSSNGQRELSLRYFQEATKLGGAQSIVSNAVDMAKWMLFHLSSGRNKKGRVVVPSDVLERTYMPVQKNSPSSREFRQPHTPEEWRDDGISLGWTNGSYREFNVLSSTKAHLSLARGYEARMTLYPSQQLGIFTAFTGKQLSYSAQSALHAAIADIILDQNTWLNTSTICSFPAPWVLVPKEIKRPQPNDQPRQSNLYKSFHGVYYNEIYGRIIVFQNTTIGGLQMQYGPIRSALRPMSSKPVFHAQGEGDFWLFKVTVTFHFIPGKAAFMTIPEFVPNSPTNPIRFKLTNTKIPNEYLQSVQTSTSSAPSVSNERITQGGKTQPTQTPSVGSTQLTTERLLVTERSSTEEGQTVSTLGTSKASAITSTSDIPRSGSMSYATLPEITKEFPHKDTSATSSESLYPATSKVTSFSTSEVSTSEPITQTIPQTQFTEFSSESSLPQTSSVSTSSTTDSDVTKSSLGLDDVTSLSAHGVDTVSPPTSYTDDITQSSERSTDITNWALNPDGMTVSSAKEDGVNWASAGLPHSTPEYKTSDVKNSKSSPKDKNVVNTRNNGCGSRTFTLTSSVGCIMIYIIVIYVKL
ncbi:uncharacterized protein LOC135473330 [Liolophura sinensis]|uniref:uncharacterized protein LOC135473330 n=1 Tax=Liolophura sinensis TaxID=3198878 RepID=UPI0031595864